MQRPRDTFHLVDLASQAEAVQALLAGLPLEQKIAWLARHGKLSALPDAFAGAQAYAFESAAGLQCAFFIDGGRLVFIGDNTTWSVPRPPAASRHPTLQRKGVEGIVSRVRTWLGHGPGR